jgi:cyclase
VFRPRIIPVLLLNKDHLVKSVQFKNYNYIGDPINAVKIFNEMKADELVFIDIAATAENRKISFDFVKEVGEEANMPFTVGGGIKTLEDIHKVISLGAERVLIGSQAALNPEFIKHASENFGSSTISVCIDVKKNILGKEKVWIQNGKKSLDYNPEDYARIMEEKGVGEIIVQSITKDGTMQGYDIELVKRIVDAVKIPVIALGGAGSLKHLSDLYQHSPASGLAAGSLYVYQGIHKGVLISYPNHHEKSNIYES